MTRDISGCMYFRDTEMTQRGPKTLSRFYGFQSLQATASSLSRDAMVLDVGAGASRFGHAVSELRPDVHWINLDIEYAHQTATAALQKDAPDNLSFREGDFTRLTSLFSANSFDRIFSYFALNYLSEEQAHVVVQQMTRVAKPTGQLAVGKLWIGENHVMRAHTMRLRADEFSSGQIADHVSQALRYTGAAPLEGVNYTPITGGDSIT